MSIFNLAVIVAIGACAAPVPPLRARVPSAVQADDIVALEGRMEVLVEDLEHSSRILYFLISGEQRVALRFMTPPRDLLTGTRVRVRGRWAKDGAFVVETFERF